MTVSKSFTRFIGLALLAVLFGTLACKPNNSSSGISSTGNSSSGDATSDDSSLGEAPSGKFLSVKFSSGESSPQEESTTSPRERLVPEHEITPAGDFLAVDLLHGEGGNRLRVERTWDGPDGGNGHFGLGWCDSNVIWLKEETENMVVVTRGPLVWIVATRYDKGEYTSQYGDTIQSDTGSSILTRASGAKLFFDSDGRLARLQPEIGPAADLSYSPEGQLLEIRLGPNNALHYLYDGERVILIEGPEGLHVEYIYDGDRLVEVTNGWKHRVRYNYADDGTLLNAVDQYENNTPVPQLADVPAVDFLPLSDFAGEATDDVPKEPGEPDIAADPLENEDDVLLAEQLALDLPPAPKIEFDDQGRVTRVEERGRTVEYGYDNVGRLQSETAADGTIEWTYDEFDRIETARHPDGTRLTYSYSNHDQPVRIESSSGEWDIFEYNEHGDIVLTTSSDGSSTTYEYDELGRLNSVQPSGGVGKQYSYNSDDDLIGITYSNGREVSFLYDTAGRRIATTWSTGEYVVRVYGQYGHLVSKDVNGLVTTYGYDDQGRLETISDPIHGEKRFDDSQYADQGLSLTWGETTWTRRTNQWVDPVESVLTGDGIERQTMYLYHPTGEISDVGSATGRFWSYLYDDAGRPLGIELPGGQRIDLERDHAGRLTKVTRDGVDYRTWLYDTNGRLQMETSPGGIAAVYSWDKAGRVREVIEPDDKVQYEYDDHGLVASIDSSNYVIRQEHHSDGSLARRNYEAAGLDLHFPIDEASRPAGISLNDIEVRYEYDELSRVNSIVLPGDARIWILRDEAGRPTEIAFGDNARMGLTWDQRDRVTSVGTSSGPENFLTFLEQYEYDPAGNLVNLQSFDQPARKFIYDADDRLTYVQSEIATTNYEYDDNDNLAVVETGGVRQRWELDSGGRPQYLGTRTSYLWDNGGNLSTIDDLDVTVGNSFDATGRLVHRRVGDFDWTFGYLPDGDRLWQEGPQGRTWYAYQPEGLTATKDESGTPWLVVNLPGTDRPLALCGPDGATLFVVTDHLNSIRRILDPEGQVLSSTEYGEFGQVADNVGSAPLAMYAGLVRDNHGLYYARRRYYDPALLRFISIDPWTGTNEFPASHNAYAYAANNPLRFRDSSGVAPEDASGRLRTYLDQLYPDQLSDQAIDPDARKLLESASGHRPVAPRMEAGDLQPAETGGLPTGKRITIRSIPASRHAPQHQQLIDELKQAERGLHHNRRRYGRLANTPLHRRDIFEPLEREVERARTALREYEESRFRGGGTSGSVQPSGGTGPGSGGGSGGGGRGSGSSGPAGRDTRPVPAAGQGGAAATRDTRPIPAAQSARTARDTRRLPRAANGPPRASSFVPATQRQASTLNRARTRARGVMNRTRQVANGVRNSELVGAGVRALSTGAKMVGVGAVADVLWHAAFDTTDPNELATMVIDDATALPRLVRDLAIEAPNFAERIARGATDAVANLERRVQRDAAIRDAEAKLLEILNRRFDNPSEFEVVPNVVETPGYEDLPSEFREEEVEIPGIGDRSIRSWEVLNNNRPRLSPEFRGLLDRIRENVNSRRPPLSGIVWRTSDANQPDNRFNAAIAKATQELDERDRIAAEVFQRRDKAERALRAAGIAIARAQHHPGAPSKDLVALNEAIEELQNRTQGIQRIGNARQEALAKEIENTAKLVCEQTDDESAAGPTNPPADLDPHASGMGARLATPKSTAIDGSPLGTTVGADEAIIRAAEEKLTRFNSMFEATRLPVEGLKSAMQNVRRLRRKVHDETKPDDPVGGVGDAREHLKEARDHLAKAVRVRDLDRTEAQLKKAIQLRRSAWNRLVPWSRTRQAKELMQRAFALANQPPGLLHEHDRPTMTYFELDRELRKLWNARPEDAEEALGNADQALDEAAKLLEQLKKNDKQDAEEDVVERKDDIHAQLNKLKRCLSRLKQKNPDGGYTTATDSDAFAALDPTHAFEKQQWTLTLRDEEQKKLAQAPVDPVAPDDDAPEDKANPFEKKKWTLTLKDPDPAKKPKPIIPVVPETTFRPSDFDIAARPNREPTQPATKYPFDVARPPQRQPSQPATKHQGEIPPQRTAKHGSEIPAQSKQPKHGTEIPTRPVIRQPQLASVPDVRGLPVQRAGDVIKQAGLAPSFNIGTHAPNVPRQYEVYAQQPAPRARVLPGSGVRVVFFDKPSTQLVAPARRPKPTPAIASKPSVPKQPREITPPVTKRPPGELKPTREIPTQPPEPSLATVPDVSGIKAGEASQRIRQAGLTPKFKSGNDAPSQEKSYKVYAQSPNAGKRVAMNSTVDVTIYGNYRAMPPEARKTPPESKPTREIPARPAKPSLVAVPDVSGLSAGDARSRLQQADLKPNFKSGKDAPSQSKSYKVYSQSPSSGQRVAENSSVDVTIYGSYRTSTVTVPNVSELSWSQASSRLSSAGLKPKRISGRDAASKNRESTVYRQSPTAGQSVSKGSSVDVTVYGTYREPSVQVPNLAGLSYSSAASRLRSAGLVPRQLKGSAASSKSKESKVYRQSPRAGESVTKGSSVDVTVYGNVRVVAKPTREVPEDFGNMPKTPSGTSRMVKVPNVSRKHYTEAKRLLESAGLKAKITYGMVAYKKDLENKVFHTEPRINQEVPHGSIVELKVYQLMSAADGTIEGTWKCSCGEKWLFYDAQGKSGKEYGPGWNRILEGAMSGRTLRFSWTSDNADETGGSKGSGVVAFNSSFTKGNWRMTNERGQSWDGTMTKDDGKDQKKKKFNKAGVTIINRSGKTLKLDIEYRSDKSGSWKWYTTRKTIPSGYSGPLSDSRGTIIAATSIRIGVKDASGKKISDGVMNLMRGEGTSYEAETMGMNVFNIEREK